MAYLTLPTYQQHQIVKHIYWQSISLIVMLLLGCCSLAGGQHFGAFVQRYGPEQGLAHREVNAILQDRQDFMWFGTRFGLNRFDGTTFTTYTRGKNGLGFDDIQSIAQDADGLLWLLGPEGKSAITIFNPLTGVATSFEKRFNQTRRNHPPVLPQIRLLNSPDGTIFFIDYQPAKLNVYHPKSGLKTVPLPQYTTLMLAAVTTRNTVWAIANRSQLVELTPDGRVLHAYVHSGPIHTCLGQRHAGTEFFYWVEEDEKYPYKGQLYKIDESGRRQEQSRTILQPNKLQQRVAYAFDQSGRIWNGYQLHDSADRIALDVSDQLASGLLDDRSFFRDRNGSFWLGTSFGLYQMRLNQHYFERLFYQSGTGKQPAVRGITAVGDTLYTNLENGIGLFASNRSGASAHLLLDRPRSLVSLSGNLDGKLYLCEGYTLIAYDYRTTKRTVTPIPGPGTIWTIHPFSNNPRRLLAGGEPGLWVVDPTTNQVTAFRDYNQFPELAQAYVLHINTDRQGTLWLCASTGLYTVDPRKGVTARYWSGGKGSFKLPADSYQHFYQDPLGLFWLATANAGLIRWDRSQSRYRQFRRADGLNNDNIYAVYADRRGHLWLSSDNGIMQFDPVRLTTRTYTEQEGITHNEFNRIAHYQDAQGRLYFGGLNGVTAFNPRDFDAEPALPALPLRMVSFRQFDASRNTLVDKTEELLKTRQITLQPNDRSSILHFALLNYTDAQKNKYAYQFSGLADTWHYQAEPYLRLGNLPYGDYKLLIKGQAADGRMSVVPLSFKVRVLRPFYLRGWFLFSMVFLMLGGVWGWGRWRNRQYHKAQIRLQTRIDEATRTIARQAQDLKQLDEAKSHFFANISHEFRTPLTIILGMADRLHQQADPQLKQSASMIERNGQSLLRLVNQILDLTKLEAGAMSLQPVRADLVGFIQYVAESFQTMATTKGIQLHFQADQSELDTDFDKGKLGDILSNLFTNALKFTPAGGLVSCTLAIYPIYPSLTNDYYEAVVPTQPGEGPWISIHVRNTGPGISAQDLPHIFDRFYQRSAPMNPTQPVSGTGIGLSLVRELLVLMNGGLAVRSQPGEGAEFAIRLRQIRQNTVPLTLSAEPIVPYPTTPDKVELMANAGADKPVLLLVEDNDDVARYIVSCIQTDYQVLCAPNGQAGIDLALEKIPDLIISDVMMPLKDGFELCGTLKSDERTSHIPIVLLTARAATDDRLTGLRRGGDAYLVKPFQREELLLVLSNLLQTQRRLQRYYSQRALGDLQPGPVSLGETDAKEDQFLAKLRRTLEDHLDNVALDNDMICQLMGMSRNSLYRKLMALTGMSTTPYLRTLRVQKAEELLKYSTLSITEVACVVGFGSTRHFRRVFMEENGVSPTAFRTMKQPMDS
ncbi:hybrid sensor histidine kinase/response regulator transcription factor [Spirosoma oryzicola]|uniref:hybrid sensor histidine kinase/response regulator transcription factor n=1 Tax=Spirosoma oryzicola TaxID=2898794 RepID=UPI001E45B667|nr:two-component regulator propeller domain-containing protein [Spirosoma oryzicola]UHG93766.1 response regulator [Spirosoma oryzicola]